MKSIGLTAVALTLMLLSLHSADAQQLDKPQGEVWQTVEARWRAWQSGDLEKMLALCHPRFHAWNRVSGRLDDHNTLRTRWRNALEAERILDVKLEPITVEVYGDFAAVFYVSRETVKQVSVAGSVEKGTPSVAEPSLVTIRWSDYLVKAGGRWLFVGYSGVPCSQSEPAGTPCRTPDRK
jgi:hypothetical protein